MPENIIVYEGYKISSLFLLLQHGFVFFMIDAGNGRQTDNFISLRLAADSHMNVFQKNVWGFFEEGKPIKRNH